MQSNPFIDECLSVEKAVTSLYRDMMKLFPEQKDFWQDLVNDEINHSSFLKDVQSLNLETELRKSEVPPVRQASETSLKLVKEVSEKISKGDLILKDALSMAKKIEESMVEAYTNRVIASLLSCDDQGYDKLISDEKRHIKKIEKMLKEQNRKP